MGNLPKQLYTFHSNSLHPIQGQVPVWAIKNEGKYVMRIKINPQPQRISLYEKIGKEESFHLVKYFGNIYQNEQEQELLFLNKQKKVEEKQMDVSQKSQKGQKSEISQKTVLGYEKIKEKLKSFKPQKKSKNQKCKEKGLLFFQYLNYDLHQKLLDLAAHKSQKMRLLKSEEIIQLIDSTVNAALTLLKHTIFLDFNFKIIEYAASNAPQIYWGHVLPDNMHRSFLKYFEDVDKIEHSFYSPEQLKTLNNDTQQKQGLISMEKSSVYSLGMVLLQCLTLQPSKNLYDYTKLKINQEELKNRIKSATQMKQYSHSIKTLLVGMLQESASKRLKFSEILPILYK